MRELRLEVPVGSTVDDAWDAVVGTVPALAPGRASLRFAVNGTYADPDTTLADGDEVACIPPVSGGSDDGRLRILEIHEAAFPADLVQTLSERLATDEDGGVVAFTGRTRATPGTPAPGQEAEARRHEGRRVDGLEYEAFEPMAVRVLEAIADEIEARFGVRRLAIVHRSGAVPLGEASVIVVAVAPHRDAAFARGALRDRRDQGAGADLEGGAVHRRARLGGPCRANRGRARRLTAGPLGLAPRRVAPGARQSWASFVTTALGVRHDDRREARCRGHAAHVGARQSPTKQRCARFGARHAPDNAAGRPSRLARTRRRSRLASRPPRQPYCGHAAARRAPGPRGPPRARDGAGRRLGHERGRLDHHRPGARDPAPVRRLRARPRRPAARRGGRRPLSRARSAAPRRRDRAAVRDGAGGIRPHAAGARARGGRRQRRPRARGRAARGVRPAGGGDRRRRGARAGRDGPDGREPHRAPRAAGGARRPAAAVGRHGPRGRRHRGCARRGEGRHRRRRRARPGRRAAQPRARGADRADRRPRGAMARAPVVAGRPRHLRPVRASRSRPAPSARSRSCAGSSTRRARAVAATSGS